MEVKAEGLEGARRRPGSWKGPEAPEVMEQKEGGKEPELVVVTGLPWARGGSRRGKDEEAAATRVPGPRRPHPPASPLAGATDHPGLGF